MPKGSRGEKRPVDVIGNAVKVVWVTIGKEPSGRPAAGFVDRVRGRHYGAPRFGDNTAGAGSMVALL